MINVRRRKESLIIQLKSCTQDIDVTLWIDFHEFYGYFPCKKSWAEILLLSMKTLHAEFAEFKGKVRIIHWNYTLLG